MTVRVRALTDEDRAWIDGIATDLWGSNVVVAHGEVFEPATLEGLVAEEDGERAGLLTYRTDGESCGVITIDAFEPRRGVGTALVGAVLSLGHRRVWLITTNDNVPAQRFYERLPASSGCARASSNARVS